MVYVLDVFISFGAENENAPQTVLSCIPCCLCCFPFTVTSNYFVFFFYVRRTSQSLVLRKYTGNFAFRSFPLLPAETFKTLSTISKHSRDEMSNITNYKHTTKDLKQTKPEQN